MPRLHSLTVVLVSAVITLGYSQETVSITQSKTGKTIPIVIVGVNADILTFKTEQGQQFDIPISQLTPDSVERIKAKLTPSVAPSAESLALGVKLNEIIGHQLFEGTSSLWNEDAEVVAKRLSWRLESKKKDSSSYRHYTDKEYVFLGAHPYCVTLYGGANGKPERFSLVYANKGDFGSNVGMGPDHFKKMHPDRSPPENLEDAIKLDAEIIAETLSKGLGAAETQYFGEKEDKRKVQRWNLGDHVFLLSTMEGEYTSLLLVNKEEADAEGKVKFIPDTIIRKKQLTNVTQSENGDVWIDNIPMVNQGPKGYCAPATFERAMRYMQIPADMYLLATAATTAEGGTNTMKLSEDCKRIVRSKARRIKELNLKEDFEIKNIKKFIDEGVPVLWQMRSLEEYNEIANSRSKTRKEISDFGKWTLEIKAEAEEKILAFEADQSNFHICMVIGYNEKTREVAVSDSWGPNYELRWVHELVCKAVTSSGGFVIDF